MKSPVLLAVILLLSTLATVGYQVFELNRLRLENVSAMVEPLYSQQSDRLVNGKKLPSLTELATLNLMGNPYKPAEKTVVENIVPISALKLILIGTIVKNNTSESSALIQRSNRETKRYFVGDVIEGGVALSSVAIDSVILKREDASEVLRYPQGAFSAALSSTPAEYSPAAPPAVVQFPQSAAIAAQAALQNNSATKTLPPPVLSRRMMKLRDRLRIPPNPQEAPQAQPDETQEPN